MEDVTMLYTTWPDAETAHAAAEAAVDARLAACVNILAPMTSVYRWDGRLETASEVPVLFKTTTARAEELRALLLARHPYDLPAMIALPAGPQSHQPYLDWVAAETSDPSV
ncbi:MAG: divalent-cation tolerance protein CutA [Caulobacteraceae bacterium]